MASFNAPATVLPLYTRGPAVPSLTRRIVVLLAQLLVAAGYGFAAVGLPPNMLFLLILPVVVCLLVALWLMPDRGVFPLKAVERSYYVLLVLMVVWPTYIAVVLPGLPWLTPTRVALFVVTLFFLYSVSTSGLLRRHLSAVARSSPLLWTAFLMWQAMMFVTLPFSHAIAQSAKILVDDQLRLTEIFFVGCLLFTKRGAATRTIATLLVLAVLCTIEGFVELKLQYPPWANHIPSFMRIDDATLANILGSQARSADGIYRVRGPFTTSLPFAEFLAMTTPFILHWLLTGRSAALKLTMAVTLVAVLAGIVITQSRLGLVGTIVAIGVYVPMWAYRQWRADRTSIIGPSILIGAPLVALALIGVVFSSHTLKMRVLGSGAQAASTEARNEQRHLAVPKILKNPIGHGLGQSGSVLNYISPSGIATVDDHYLTTLLDLGLVGALGFYGMFLVAAWLGLRAYLTTSDRETELAGPLAAMCMIFLVVKSVLSEETNHSLVLLLLGMLMALRARELKIGGLGTPALPVRHPVSAAAKAR